MCAKIRNFYGSSCTHFSRQWITSRVPEHSDTCGRDGETLPTDMPAHGAWGSAGVGTGAYTYRGQCIFFNSLNDHCCSTKAAWREAGTDTDSSYCQNKYGDRTDAWDSKHRSWRLKTSAFTATADWPVVSSGRRLAELAGRGGLNASDLLVHEFFFPNGTRFWATEEDDMQYGVDLGDSALEPDAQQDEAIVMAATWRLWEVAKAAAWQLLWR